MQRRDLSFQSLEDSIAECERLLRSGYDRKGKWSLGQICCHLRLAQDASMDGYPRWMSLFAPIRPVFRRLLLPRLLRGDSPTGIRTARHFVPPESLEDAAEVMAFAASVKRYRQHQAPLHAHPGFGKFDHQGFEKLHTVHAAHHLGFLIPRETGQRA